MEEVLIPIEVEGKSYKLPVGYRFDPSDEILAGIYLRKRIMAQQPLPNDLIQDYDVYQTGPWELPKGDDKRYLDWQRFFFLDLRTRVFENIDKRVAGNGEWRTIVRGQEVDLSDEQVFAKMNILVFWEANGNNYGFAETNWVMHEFRLASKSNPSKVSGVAVYRIFDMKEEGRKAKRAKRSEVETSSSSSDDEEEESEEEAFDDSPTVIDFKVEESGTVTGPPSPATSETF